MEREEAKGLFQPFIDEITNRELKEFTEYLFKQLPDYWFIKPASSTGKYHPKFARGDGGLVRHTLAMCKIWKVLYRGFPKEFSPEDYECGIIACIFHDALKYGKKDTFPNGYTYTTKGHEHDAAEWFLNEAQKYFNKEHILDFVDCIVRISLAIKYHMGPWSKDGVPQSFFEKEIFIADYIASSKWFEEEVFNVHN